MLNIMNIGLRRPQRGGGRWNLASLVNRQVSEESINPNKLYNSGSCGRSKLQNFIEALATRVSSKLEEGYYKDTVRLACSSATIAEQSSSTVEAMKLKHPPRYHTPIIDNQPHATPLGFTIDVDLIRRAIMSFPSSSNGELMVCCHNI